MRRLTERNSAKEGTTIGMPLAVACYWKLKEYEDLEEDLGIGLPVLLEALGKGFWTSSGAFVRGGPGYVSMRWNAIHALGNDEFFYFDEYGKTWSLEKGELPK